MSTALSTGRTGGEPSVSESAARRSHKEPLPPPETEDGEPGKLKKATKKASHREAFFLSEFGSGRGVGFEKKGKAPDSA